MVCASKNLPHEQGSVERHLRSIAAGLLIPFGDDEKIEHHKLRENAESLSDQGIETFLVTANISEYHSLSQRERIEVAEIALEASPSDACVIAGVGGLTSNAVELIDAYDRIGVDAMMIMPPDHTNLHERGLLRYYGKFDETTETPLVPYVRGFDPSVAYLRDLTHIDGIVGIKYALKDPVKRGAGSSAREDDVRLD